MPSRRSALRGILPLLVLILFVAVLVGGSSSASAYCMTLGQEVGAGCEPPPYNNPATLSNEITAPKPGAAVKGIVTVTANPGGVKNADVNRVEFYVDNILIGIDMANPWRTDWNTLDPDFVAYDGTHSLTSIAYTNSGRATSPAVSVTTTNTAGTQYRATITSTPVPQEISYDAGGTQLTYPVDVTVRNNSALTWSTTAVKLNYRWYSPDPTPVVTNGTAVAFTSSVLAGTSRTLRVNVLPPTLTTGISKAQYQLRFDLIENGATWFADKGNAPLENPVIDAKVLEAEALGLEKFYHYEGEDLGAGMQHLLNVANGNSLLRWTPWQSPGRGLATVLDITYNSFEKKCECPLGNNFSVAISTLNRLGLPLDIHPNNADTIAGRSNKYVVLTDGDGTPQKFIGKNAADGTTYWEEPAGVHLHLRSITTDPLSPRYWAITRPDRVTWYFDREGFPTSVEDRNGNAITYTLSTVAPGDDPGGVTKRITKVTDAGGDFFAIDYFTKAEVKKPKIRGKIQSITDHGGHRLLLDYYADGNLRKITQEGGTKADGFTPLPSRSFVFTYTTSDGSGPAIPTPALRVDPDPETSNQSTRVYSVRDPRGTETLFTYYGPTSGQLRWRLLSRADRTSQTTNYGYDLVNRATTVTDPLGLASKYAYDTSGQVTTITNPKNQLTTVDWTADRMIQKVTEPGGAFREFAYNANGYITDEWDQLRNQTHLDYQNVATDASDVSGKWKAGRSIPHISQVVSVTAPKGMATTGVADDFQTLFAYDAEGNMTKMTGPEGHPSPADPDGQFTAYTWNPDGTLASETDANGKTTAYAYDNQGLVTKQTDPLGHEKPASAERLAELGCHGAATRDRRQACPPIAERGDDGGRAVRVAPGQRRRVLQESPQGVRAVVVRVGDRRSVDRRHDGHVHPGPAEDDVQALLAALLVDRPEVHDHPAVAVGPVADAHQDDVALVALDVLEVLHEQPDDLVVVLADQLRLVERGERGVGMGERLELALDLGLLRLGEGDDADRQTGLAAQQLADESGDVCGLTRVRALDVRRPVDPMDADGPREQGVDAGDRLVLADRHEVRSVQADLGQ